MSVNLCEAYSKYFTNIFNGHSATKSEAESILKAFPVDYSKIISLVKSCAVSQLLIARAGYTEMFEHIGEDAIIEGVSAPTYISKLAYAIEKVSKGDYSFLEDESMRFNIPWVVYGYYADKLFKSKGGRSESYIKSYIDSTLNWESEVSAPIAPASGKVLYVENGFIKAKPNDNSSDIIEYPKNLPNSFNGYFGYYVKYQVSVYKSLFSNFNTQEDAEEFIFKTF